MIRRKADDRLFQVPDGFWQPACDLRVRTMQLIVVRFDLPDQLPLIETLVKGRRFEAHGEGPEMATMDLPHRRGDHRRIEAAAHVGSDRDIAVEPDASRIIKECSELLGCVLLRETGWASVREVPVALHGEAPILEGQRMGG